jgi:hypothetical protein
MIESSQDEQLHKPNDGFFVNKQASAPLIICLRLSFWIVITLLILVVLNSFLINTGIGEFGRANLGSMVYGTAHRPFVYRVLVPTIVRLTTPFVPVSIVESAMSIDVIRGWLSLLDAARYPREAFVTLLVLCGSLFGFVVVFRQLMTDLGYSEFLKNIVNIVTLSIMPLFFLFGYIYDFTGLFLITLGLLLLSQKRFAWFLLVFVLATLNKETSILLTVIFVLHYWRRIDRNKFLWITIIQLALFFIIKGSLTYYFSGNPGSFVEYHLSEHILFFKIAPTALLILSLILAIGLVLLVIIGWKHKPVLIRNSTVIFAPLFVTYIFFGFPLEMRVFLEFLPILMILFLPAFKPIEPDILK